MKRVASLIGPVEPNPVVGGLTAVTRAATAPAGGFGVGRPLLHMLSAARHWRSLHALWRAPEHSLLEALTEARPEVWTLPRVRFLTSTWNPSRRIAALADHCGTVERLGRPFDLRPHQAAEIAPLTMIADGLRLVMDSPRWLFLDGLLALNIFEGDERLYSIAFILSSDDGPLTAYVGGIQGRSGEGFRDRYRLLTKSAWGVRPADMMVELLRMVCAEIGVERLACVADRWRHQLGPIASRRADFVDPVRFDYDALWQERGGVLGEDGFYDLPIDPERRPLEDVPAKKRAERRRRYEMLDAIRATLAGALAHPQGIIVVDRESGGGPQDA